MTILVVVAHPDDEVLGAGGTLARHAAQGEDIHIVFLADGVGARGADKAAAERRALAAGRAAQLLGARQPQFLGFPDQLLDTIPLLEVVKAIESVVDGVRPDVIYTHHRGDLNIDHSICHRAVMTASRPLPGSSVRQIYTMEVVSSTEWSLDDGFTPTRFVDIAGTLATKRRAYEAVDALARCRGASVGVAAAEAFMIARYIET
jgi:LmbE family N-acetylglucosaminyl deacetylase